MYVRSLFLILFCLPMLVNATNECRSWFQRAQLKVGTDCLVKCVAAAVDMNTFHCPNLCEKLCKSPKKEHLLFKISKLYPGLTGAERALIVKYPKEMLQAYKLTWESENLCATLFVSSKRNDASDACRHFVWAALLYKRFGFDLSVQILNAHEKNSKQPEEEKAMDLANNRFGIIVAKQLLENEKWSKKAILKSFQLNLKRNNIVVLKKNVKPISGGKK